MAHQTPTIKAQRRERVGTRYARRLRRQGRLPAVIYGHQREPVAVSVDQREVIAHLKHGTHVLVLEIDGAKAPETCLVKELQFGYLGDDVVHIDFARVDLDEEVDVNVSLHFVGTSESAQRAGAILSHDLTDLEVICRVNAIPDEIRVDLSVMGDQTVLTVGDLKLPAGIRAAADPETPVVHITYVKEKEAAVGEEVELEAAPAEPELISEGRAEEEPEPEQEPRKGEAQE